MTSTSLTELNKFLRLNNLWKHRPSARVGDFGGTDNIGGESVRSVLEINGFKDYHMLDLDNKIDLMKPVKGKKFDLGICMDLLEHVQDPFLVARNIQNALKPGSFLFVTTPWMWPEHSMPDKYGDYWRFTPMGLELLFKGMQKAALFAVYDTYRLKKKLPKEAFAPKEPWSRIIGVFFKA